MTYRQPTRAPEHWFDWDLTWYAVDGRGEIASFSTASTDWSPLYLQDLFQVADNEHADLPLTRWGDAIDRSESHPYWRERAALGIWAYDAREDAHAFLLCAQPTRPRLLDEMPPDWARKRSLVYYAQLAWRDLPSIPTSGPTEPRWLDRGVLWSEL